MSNPTPGWYPDPAGDPTRLRYWDGTSWTEHFAPVQPPAADASPGAAEVPTPAQYGMPAATETAATTSFAPLGSTGQPDQASPEGPGSPQPADPQQYGQAQQYGQTQQFGEAPYGQAQQYGQAPQQYAQAPGYGQPQQYGQATQHYGENPYGQQPGQGAPGSRVWQQDGQGQPEQGPNKKLIIAIVGGAVAVIALVVALVLFLGGEDDDDEARPTPSTTSQPTRDPRPTPSETDEATSDAPGGAQGEPVAVSLGEELTGSLPSASEWIGTLTLDAPGVLLIDVRSADEDLVLEVIDSEGTSYDNDDRADFLEDDGSRALDPALAVALPAGEVQIVVHEYGGDPTDFSLNVRPVEVISAGATTAEIPEGGDWLRVIEIPADGTYVFDTISVTETSDPVLTVISPDGEEFSNDDSPDGAGAWSDPYLAQPLTAGLYLVTLHDWSGEAGTVDLTITGP